MKQVLSRELAACTRIKVLISKINNYLMDGKIVPASQSKT
jgi:hypothetical protein